jgi:hypothetical protein
MPQSTSERLQKVGGSLHQLLLDLPDTDAITDTIDYLLGALYGLYRAQELGFRDRGGQQFSVYRAHLANDALRIPKGQTVNQLWLAGFYFNSAIQRLASAFDRIPKMLDAKKTSAADRMKEVNRDDYAHWEHVYREVNDFKHKPVGRYAGRGVAMADALAAFDQTLTLLTKGSTTLKPKGNRHNPVRAASRRTEGVTH